MKLKPRNLDIDFQDNIDTMVVETEYDNQDMKSYNVRYQLSKSIEFAIVNSQSDYLSCLTPLGNAIVKELLNIRGISSISFKDVYSLTVIKGRAFSFEELDCIIVPLIKKYLRIENSKEEKQD